MNHKTIALFSLFVVLGTRAMERPTAKSTDSVAAPGESSEKAPVAESATPIAARSVARHADLMAELRESFRENPAIRRSDLIERAREYEARNQKTFGLKEAAQLMLLESERQMHAAGTSLPYTGREEGSWSEWWEAFINPPLYHRVYPCDNPTLHQTILAFRGLTGTSVKTFRFLKRKFWG